MFIPARHRIKAALASKAMGSVPRAGLVATANNTSLITSPVDAVETKEQKADLKDWHHKAALWEQCCQAPHSEQHIRAHLSCSCVRKNYKETRGAQERRPHDRFLSSRPRDRLRIHKIIGILTSLCFRIPTSGRTLTEELPGEQPGRGGQTSSLQPAAKRPPAAEGRRDTQPNRDVGPAGVRYEKRGARARARRRATATRAPKRRAPSGTAATAASNEPGNSTLRSPPEGRGRQSAAAREAAPGLGTAYGTRRSPVAATSPQAAPLRASPPSQTAALRELRARRPRAGAPQAAAARDKGAAPAPRRGYRARPGAGCQ